jgi:hypothetical protein
MDFRTLRAFSVAATYQLNVVSCNDTFGRAGFMHPSNPCELRIARRESRARAVE